MEGEVDIEEDLAWSAGIMLLVGIILFALAGAILWLDRQSGSPEVGGSSWAAVLLAGNLLLCWRAIQRLGGVDAGRRGFPLLFGGIMAFGLTDLLLLIPTVGMLVRHVAGS